jgi:putative DNA primase/helicase
MDWWCKMSASDIEAIQTAALKLTNAPRKQGFSLYPKDGGAIHHYTALDGSITFARLRLKNPETGDKWIRPLRRDASGVWSELKAPEFAGGAPLYFLHQLSDTARQSERVILTEGEYKADMLAARGILVTTSGGAQSVDATDWQPLTGRNVLVWADNDKAGFEYAKQAADKLLALGCAVAFIDVDALNLPPKGDAVDWLKAFHQQHGRKAAAADVWALPVIDRAPETVEIVEAVESVLSPSVVAGDADVLPESAAQSDTSPAQSDDAIIQWLATLKPLEYERVRGDQAKAMNCRPAVLDSLVKAVRSEASEAGRLPFVEVEPHHDPIDPAQLLDEVSTLIQRFIVLDPEQAHAAALWCALTWFIDVVEVAPLAIINAPEKACGKTQLLTVLGRMAYRPLPASNASASALFRAVEAWKPTILIDEADTFFRDNAELHGMVNAGYLRDGFVLRSEAVGDSFEPRMFSVFSAKALAGIALEKHLPDATMSRGVVFNLRRKLSHESVNRLRHADRDLFAGIAEKLARFAADYSQQVRQARPILPDALSDRDQDNWDGLLAIASCAGDAWLERATSAALKLSGAGEKTQSTGNELLADIQHVFESKHIEKISTVNLIEELCEDEEGAWATYNRGKPINPRQVKKRLEAYGIASKTIRLGAYETAKGFELKQFADSFERYLSTPLNLPSQSNKPLEANSGKGFDVTSIKSQDGIGNSEVTPKAAPLLTCDRVTAKTPILGDATAPLKNASHLRI